MYAVIVGLDGTHTHIKAVVFPPGITAGSYRCVWLCSKLVFITSLDALTRWVYVVLLNFDPLAHTSAAVCITNFKVQRHGTRSGIQPINGCLTVVQSMGRLVLHKGLWVRIAICLPFCRIVTRYRMIFKHVCCTACVKDAASFSAQNGIMGIDFYQVSVKLLMQLHLHLKRQCACFTVNFYLVFYFPFYDQEHLR